MEEYLTEYKKEEKHKAGRQESERYFTEFKFSSFCGLFK
jgi:hypothetical protein